MKHEGDSSSMYYFSPPQGRIKASAGPGAVPNAGPLQTYNQLTTPTNCGPGCCSTPCNPLMRHWSPVTGLLKCFHHESPAVSGMHSVYLDVDRQGRQSVRDRVCVLPTV